MKTVKEQRGNHEIKLKSNCDLKTVHFDKGWVLVLRVNKRYYNGSGIKAVCLYILALTVKMGLS
jgi:hypothetical protein